MSEEYELADFDRSKMLHNHKKILEQITGSLDVNWDLPCCHRIFIYYLVRKVWSAFS